MKRRYNKNNLKRKKRTKMRSKIRSKVYKRTKKKHLSKKKRHQSAGSRVLTANSQLIMSSGDEDIKEVEAANSMIEGYTDGIQVLLKINNGYKKCRKLKFEKEEQGHFRVVFYAVGDNDAETVKESFYCGVWLSEGETVSVVGDNIVINRRSRRYEITPVGNCTRSEKWHLPAFFGGKGSRFSNDTSSGSSSVTTGELEQIFDLIKAAEKAKEDQIRDLQNADSVQSHGTL